MGKNNFFSFVFINNITWECIFLYDQSMIEKLKKKKKENLFLEFDLFQGNSLLEL